MKRHDMLLGLILMASALAVVQVQNVSRQQFMQMETLKRETRDLDVDWGKVQIEQSTLADPKRVAELAKSELGLILPPLDKVWLVEAGGSGK